MSRIIHPDTLVALGQGHIRWLIFARMEFESGTLAFNSSLNEISFDGFVYEGAGSLGSVSSTSESGDLDPNEYKISLSGVQDFIIQTAATEKYMNKYAVVHAAVLDEQYEIIGEPFIWFEGLTDSVNVEYGKFNKVTINVKDRLADWSRARVERYSNEEQKREHPDDNGFEYVTEVASKEVTWPDKRWFEKNA